MKTTPILALAGLLLAGAVAHAQSDEANIVTETVADGIYMLKGRGGNIGVSTGEDGVFLIDDQYAPLAPKIRSAVEALNSGPVKFVVNTHFHADHTGGNASFAESGALIISHDNARKRMTSDQMLEAIGNLIEAQPSAGLPVMTFTRTARFYLNGQEIQVIHVPRAHTDGDSIVFFPQANVVHAGDVYFNGLYPFIDTESGGGVEGMLDAVDVILALGNEQTLIIPGHGPVSRKTDLRAYRDMLQTVRDRIMAQLNEGMDPRKIIETQPTRDFDAVWGGGFLKPHKWTTMMVRDLMRL